MYPSSAHSFSPIGMKLGTDTPWDPAGDMGNIKNCANPHMLVTFNHMIDEHQRKKKKKNDVSLF